MKRDKKERKHISRKQFIGTSFSLATGMAVGSKAAFGASNVLKKTVGPNSQIAGVEIGAITYSFRSMEDESAESILQALVNSGMGYTELMGDTAEVYAGAPPEPDFDPPAGMSEEEADAREDEIEAAHEVTMREWRQTVSMERYRQLRRMFNDAGVQIYAWKPGVFGDDNTDDEMAYGFRVARALGATHCTRELPDDPALSARIGRIGEQYEISMAYHNHTQATPTLLDTAMEQSPYNAINLDAGHYVAAGYDPIPFIREHHERIHSMHLKDRTTPANGQENLMWGQGDTPIAEILQLIRDEEYNIIPTVELEYDIPEGSNAVIEVARCLAYCRNALMA